MRCWCGMNAYAGVCKGLWIFTGLVYAFALFMLGVVAWL